VVQEPVLKIAPLMQLSIATLANLALRQLNMPATVGRIRANDMQWRLLDVRMSLTFIGILSAHNPVIE
jgi:hypothetical protein